MRFRVAMLAPIAWRTPPRHYGPWEQVVATLTDELVAAGVDVTLYATGDSITSARLVSVVDRGYADGGNYDVKVFEALHIARCFEDAGDGRYDIVHNHFDFLPLAWSRLVPTPVVTTIHGFSSNAIVPAYRRYDGHAHYVAISAADRHPDLTYAATIHHGIDLDTLRFRAEPDADGHVVCFGRIHPDKGTDVAIDVARAAGRPIVLAGIVHDEQYFEDAIRPRLGSDATYIGSVGGADRAAVLGAASALVHTVSFAEPFGLSVVEALACGTPVVAFDRGAMRELVRPGVNGHLAADAQEAVSALGRIGAIDRRRCRADAEQRFSASRMAADYLAVYEQVVATSEAAGIGLAGGRSGARQDRIP